MVVDFQMILMDSTKEVAPLQFLFAALMDSLLLYL